jgi:serine/threonine-protein kinase HipA
LAIAKFPKKDDEIDIIGWEVVALTLAAKARIATPQWRLESVKNQRVLISRRFDRHQKIRTPFLSAMSALQARDNEPHSYLEIADVIRQISASPQSDLHALWRRMVFNVLISNVDDHLRNHAFLYSDTSGWTLSPAYDLNPTPTDIKPRVLSTAIDLIDPSASIELAFNVGAYFELSCAEMKQIAKEVALATSEWESTAKRLKITKKEIERMASAFEHEDLKKAARQ